MTEFGVNVITIPPGYESGRHMHERQQELYFVHMGTLELEFGDGAKQVLKEGGYVGRDGLAPEDEGNPRGPGL